MTGNDTADGPRPDLSRTDGSVAAAYDRGCPGYPSAAVDWLVNGEARIVLELGAGTGKLTRALVDAGHAVFATDPDQAMLDVLAERVPEVSAKQGAAEGIPVNDRSVDVVVAGQAFDWFDAERALPEIARVLRPGGHVAMAWNSFDERIPWVRRLAATIGERRPEDAASSRGTIDSHIDVLTEHELFEAPERQEFAHWQDVDRDLLVDIVASRSYIAALPETERTRRLDDVRALYDEYGRGHEGMQLPYRTQCFRARVALPGDQLEPIVSDGSDTDMLLIDFR